MARFTVRIEMRDTKNGDGYAALNRAMAAQGFSRIIGRSDGRQYDLPTAEYRMTGRRTLAQVCRLAKAGASDSSGDAAILVTEGKCSWHNLRGSAK
jgi:hypothetical protein